MTYDGAARLAHLGSIMKTGRKLDEALNALTRAELRSLADLIGCQPDRSTAQLAVSVRRRLIGLHKIPAARSPEVERVEASGP